MKPKRRGQIVSDPTICHGRPTFRGTRILVSDVLDLVADGMSWDDVVQECHGHITRSSIAEAIRCAGLSIVKHADEYAEGPVGA